MPEAVRQEETPAQPPAAGEQPGGEAGANAPAPETTPSSEDVWDSILNVDDGDDDADFYSDAAETPPSHSETPPEGAEERSEEPPAEPPAEPPTQPPGEETPAPEQAAAETPPEQTPQQPSPEEPPAPATPEQQQAAYDQYVEQLKGVYQLGENDVPEYHSDLREPLGHLAAKIHANVFTHMMQQMQEIMTNVLPQQIDSVVSHRRTTEELWGSFQEQWGELADPQYHGAIREAYQRQQQANPQIATKDLIRNVGVEVWLKSGKDPAALMAKLSDTPQQGEVRERVEGSTVDAGGGGFAPAAGGAGAMGGQPGAGGSRNPYEEFAEAIMRGDYEDG